ncbi:MAG TPA: ABC transporter family substrate-binding protein [Pseudonocardiaceae bacterium]|nr:ABC transporter family substrate-binding protein [Pseudonocardiaceae bacterium]
MSVVKGCAALAATAALSLTLVACGGGGSANSGAGGTAQSFAEQAQYNPQPYDNVKDGGTLTTSLPEISTQWNIFQGNTTEYALYLWNWYNPVLSTSSADGKVSFDSDYLTDVKADTVNGNTRITYTINPKASYNDGSPIDWTAFQATWNANNGRDAAYIVNSSSGYDRIASLTRGVDDRQVVVMFNGVYVWWQGLFGSLLNPKALEPEVFNKGYIDSPHPEWGAGPYTVQKFDKQNGTVIFTRNPKWWGKKGKLDSRIFLAMEDVASINAFKNGQLDAVDVGTKDRLAQVQGMNGIDIRRGISLHSDLFTLNSRSPMLADPQVRKAVFEGIDRNQIAAITFQGLNFTETPPGSLVLFSFQDGYHDNFSQAITFNVEQAKRDLDTDGWTAGPDGMRSKGGQPLELSYVNTGDDPVGKAIAGAVVAMMRNIGVKLDIRQVANRDFSNVIIGRKFDMFYSGFAQNDPFGMAYLCQIYCSDSQLNLSGTNNPAFDAEVKSVNALPTAQQQFAKGNAIEAEAFKTYGIMPTLTLPEIVAVKKGLANYGSGRFFTATPENIGWQR